MIYSIWICYLMIKLKSYSHGINILLLTLNILDSVQGSNLYSIFNSQGIKIEILRKKNDESNFCRENLENLLNYTSFQQPPSSFLSSKYRPSNQNSSSSTTAILLPQGNESIKSYFIDNTPFFLPTKRIDSDKKKIIPPIAGCIDLKNYNWILNKTFHNKERLSGVQIFLFHFNNNSIDRSNEINLRILLYSTQEQALNRPVLVVLSSFLPRKFYLSTISFLSKSREPLHIILTHSKSELVIKDEGLTTSDLDNFDKLFISIIDLSKENVFTYHDQMKEKGFITEIHKKFMKTSLYKHGYFYGSNYNFNMKKNVSKKMWLFNNEKHFSNYLLISRIVAIYLINEKGNYIDLTIGKLWPTLNHTNQDYLSGGCQSINNPTDVISSYQKYEFDIKHDYTCYYNIKSFSSPGKVKYQSITWVHIESVSNILLDIELLSSHTNNNNNNKNMIYLVILTGDNIKDSLIKIHSLYSNQVHILTNISLNLFDQKFSLDSSLSLWSIADLHKDSSQYRTISNYISAGSVAFMKTTIYRLESNSKSIYRIRINIDDSGSIPYNAVAYMSCFIYSQENISVAMIIDFTKWKKISKWIPTQFQLGDSSCVFQQSRSNFFGITRQVKQCSSFFSFPKYLNKIYGVYKDKKYQINMEINLHCRKERIKLTTPVITTVKTEKYVEKVKNGFTVSNKSDFIYNLAKPLYDKMAMFILITYDINGELDSSDKIQLRDCYISNQKATPNDFMGNSKNSFKKLKIIREGCLNGSSKWYSNISESLRPRHLMIDNLFRLYNFSIIVNSDYWASKLSLEKEWRYNGQYEVHLYCGVNKCNFDEESGTPSLKCRSQTEQCSNVTLTTKPIMKYYGVIRIVKKFENINLKISILMTLVIMIIVLLLSIIIYCIRFYSIRRTLCQHQLLHKSSEVVHSVDPELSYSNPRMRQVNLDYHSLTLLSSQSKKSAVKLYSEPKFFASLKRLIENCDKSIYLSAGYLTSPLTDQSTKAIQPLTAVKKLRIQSHSVSEISLTEPAISNWVINSWPLSTTERKNKKSQGQKSNPHHFECPTTNNENQYKSFEPNKNCWQQNTNSSGSSSKQKISYTFNSELKSFSNPKVSSNRTTVSESMSANDMPSKSNSKWWSLLTNYWMNQSFVMSRN